MRVYSDRTLAEMLAARLRAAGLFELFVRELAPGEWYASARGFLDDGRRFDAFARDKDVGRVLLALLAHVDEARSGAAAPRIASMPLPPPRPRARVAPAPHVATPARPHLERVALELAARLDGFTLQTFAGALGVATDVTGHVWPELRSRVEQMVGTLRELVTRGELRQDGPVYRRVERQEAADAPL